MKKNTNLLSLSVLSILMSSCCIIQPYKLIKCKNGEIVRVPCNPTAAYTDYEVGYNPAITGLKASVPKIATPISVDEIKMNRVITKFHQDLDQERIEHRDSLKGLLEAIAARPCSKSDPSKMMVKYLTVCKKSKKELAQIQAKTERLKIQNAPAALYYKALNDQIDAARKIINKTSNARSQDEDSEVNHGSVFFDTGSAMPNEKNLITQKKKLFASARYQSGVFLLVGRTDGAKPTKNSVNESNYSLARERANKVAALLKLQHFKILGLPKTNQHNPSAKDRRVDIIWFPSESALSAFNYAS